MKHLLTAMTALTIMVMELPVTAVVTYDTVNLGELGSYETSRGLYGWSTGSAINDLGQVIGNSTTASPGIHSAFLWDIDNGMRALGTPVGDGNDAGRLNNNGQVIGQFGLYDMETGQLQSLNFRTTAINDSGLICGYRTNTNGYSVGCLWDEVNGLRDLVPAGNSLPAEDINSSGQICGGGYVWDSNNGMRNLGIPDGYLTCRVHAISDNGWVVGEAGYYTDFWHYSTFIWNSADGFRMLFGQVGKDYHGIDVNNRGQVLGFVSFAGGATYFVWDEVGGIQYLGSFKAYSINNNGWIAGSTTGSDGRSRAGIMIPVPEPSSLPSLLCGVAGIGGAIWRRRR